MPRFGTCWQKALGQVEAGCKRLDEDQQARLSLALVACQMDQLGIQRKPVRKYGHGDDDDGGGDVDPKTEKDHPRSYHCPTDVPLKTCTRGLDEDVNAFTAFSQFFTHTAHICYFLESQRWRETTKMTVEALLRSSDVVARGLNVSTKMQVDTSSGLKKMKCLTWSLNKVITTVLQLLIL